ncbi:hypothetical protein D9757_006216 [Collybiopsis confluens]|uniref:Mitochondrial import inner membrane translocase subunit Tim21 n=1 Tax=Collybiopsis confluens TaxID=2823264 RepID=A0A8H5M8N6_9AGAR|nr:hypothetical protein D9757_006216 [Collybiopsis confluens]
MSFLFRVHLPRCPSITRLTKARCSVLWVCRNYATHRDPLHPANLSQALDTKHQSFRPEQKVGPFQMGMNDSPFEKPTRKKWADLSTGGKFKRTTAQTSNLLVIVFGAGLTAVLLYAVGSELISKNSPTSLYSQACDRIKTSPQVARHLHGPFSFHTTRPSAERPRGRQHQVTSQIFVDAQGREHMMMTFYVQGSNTPQERSGSYLESAGNWISRVAEHLPEVTTDEAIQWTKDRSASGWEKVVGSFKYLIGAPASINSSAPSSDTLPEIVEKAPESRTQKWTGIFSSLRTTRYDAAVSGNRSDGTLHTDGEVRAEFIRNDDGYFVPSYILIDIPNSRARNPTRVFVQRAPGVRENEPVSWGRS